VFLAQAMRKGVLLFHEKEAVMEDVNVRGLILCSVTEPGLTF
jgi:hypothetical protein